jgi:outer membrane lipoprotein SlyB
MKTNLKPVVATAVIATICGMVLGGVVATAVGRNHADLYLRFVGFLAIVAICLAGAWVYQTYLRPKTAHVEETEADTTP